MRVAEQVQEIQDLARLRRFLSPQLADLIVASGGEGAAALRSHRRQVAVLFADLRGFTSFAESAEPEDVMSVLRDFHEVLGELVRDMDATVGYFAGDGLMVFFNDPLPCEDPALRAVSMAVELRKQMIELSAHWRRLGHTLGCGVGVTYGYATLGEIGFEGRLDYGAIGSVVNLASRLCGECGPGQILVSQPVFAAIDEHVEAELLAPLTLKGFVRPVPAYNVIALKRSAEQAGTGLPAGLTRREVEVLRAIAAGKSSKEIGDQLFLSHRTVERHIANIYAKIGAHGRAEATAFAITRGIANIEGPPD
jgi:class 3 adenylate cyclase